MDENLIPHFSKKILLLSLLFLLINVTWYVLTVFTQQGDPYRTVAPKLVFAEAHDVQVQTVYDKELHPAEVNQELISGTIISTGELDFAEVILENNVLRLDENTEITLLENNFVEYSTFEPAMPRLVLSISKGNVWVNAFDSIEIRAPRSSASFAHSVGSISYNEPINRLMVFTGSSDLNLIGKDGEVVNSYTVPLYNQITYLDTQIIDEYAKLRESKLKKELKMAPIASAVLENEWVIRNSEVDSNLMDLRKKFVNSKLSYSIKSGYNTIRSIFTFIPQTKRKLAIEKTEVILGYLLGGIQRDGNVEEAKLVLNDLNEAISGMPSDPLMKELLTGTFFAIGSVKMDSPAELVKEELLKYMLSQDGPYVLRSYLTDLRVSLEELRLDDAEEVASNWLAEWSKGLITKNFEEFTKQAQMLHRTILTYSDRATNKLLAVLDESGQIRLDLSDDKEETLYVVTLERLEMASALVTNYRYIAAKQFLKDSYESLGIDKLGSNSQTAQIFTERARLIAQRIEYAEERMHSASEAIDETDFAEYIQLKTRDELLSENLKEYLGVGTEPEDSEVPSLGDVIDKFTMSRVIIIDSDIVAIKDSPFTFDILKARLIDRASDGSQITFSATYDYITNAVNNVMVGSTPLKGNFGLDDLVVIIGNGKTAEEIKTGQETDIYDLLGGGVEDEALRAQTTAQELAKQLVMSDLIKYGVQVSSMDKIEVLDALTLAKFNIAEAFIVNPEDSAKPLKIQFEYSSSSKKTSNIIMVDSGKTVEGEVALSQLSQVITGDIIAKKLKEEALEQFMAEVTNQKLILKRSDVTVLENNNIEFKNMLIGVLPLSVSGTYSTGTKKFTSLSNELFEANNTEPIEYFGELGKIYILKYLIDEGFVVTENQIVMEYPFNKIEVNGYKVGINSYSFEVDMTGARLKNITDEKTGNIVDMMSFDEFQNIAPVTG